MDIDNKITEHDNTDKKLHISGVINSKNYEKCWVIRNPNGDIICVVKSDEDRMKYRKKGFYIDEYKLFDK